MREKSHFSDSLMVSAGALNEILILWSQLQKAVYYKTRIRNIEHLRQHLLECWDQLDQRQISSDTGQWRRRLQMVMRENGGHTEHNF